MKEVHQLCYLQSQELSFYDTLIVYQHPVLTFGVYYMYSNRPLTATKPIFYFDKPDVHSGANLRQSDFHLAPSFRIINLRGLTLTLYNSGC